MMQQRLTEQCLTVDFETSSDNLQNVSNQCQPSWDILSNYC